MVLLLWTPDDNVAADSAGESLVASGGFIFACMAIATQIMAIATQIFLYHTTYWRSSSELLLLFLSL